MFMVVVQKTERLSFSVLDKVRRCVATGERFFL